MDMKTRQLKTDRRRHVRIRRDDSLLVQVLAASAVPGLVGKTLHCSSLDVSAPGLRVRLLVEVPVDCEIDLWIDVTSCAQKYFLNGRVRWCDPVDVQKGIYQIGVQLLDMPFTDYKSWRDMFDAKDALQFPHDRP